MRIVHISDCYLPRLGGIENQVSGLAAFQAQQGHAVHVITATALPPDTPMQGRNRYRASTTDAPGLRVHRLATPVAAGLPVHPRGYQLLRRALRKIRPDVVHVHAGLVSPFAFDGARAANSLDLPLAILWHCRLDGAEPAIAAWMKLTGWDDVQFAAASVSPTAAEKVSQAIGREQVCIVPNAFQTKAWRASALARPPAAPHSPLRVVAAMRLAPRKRVLPLVRMIAAAHERLGRDDRGEPRITLTVAGDGPFESRLHSAIGAHGLADVISPLGRVPHEVLPTLYRDQDVFLAPAILEAGAGAGVEARVAGLAVVGRMGNGLSQFVESGVNGILADSDDGIVDALVRLAREPQTLAAMQQANIANPPALSWEDAAKAASQFYDDAIAMRTPDASA